MNNVPEYPLSFFGRIVATRQAVETVDPQLIAEALHRHIRLDWSDCDPLDRKANKQALGSGARLLGIYKVAPGVELWVETSAENNDGVREYTTVMLGSDY